AARFQRWRESPLEENVCLQLCEQSAKSSWPSSRAKPRDPGVAPYFLSLAVRGAAANCQRQKVGKARLRASDVQKTRESMKIFGLDFTSAPRSKKPITCAVCELHDNLLQVKYSLKINSL